MTLPASEDWYSNATFTLTEALMSITMVTLDDHASKVLVGYTTIVVVLNEDEEAVKEFKGKVAVITSAASVHQS